MKSFFRFVLLALVLMVVALVSALTAMRFAIHGREVAVPDLVGRVPADARRVAEASGFDFEVERQYYSANVPEGKIMSQLPPAGTQIRRGWQIRVAESLGPQRVEIPSVLGQSERAAAMNIRRRGLDVAAIAHTPVASTPADQVLAQSPLPNASGVAAPKISLLVTVPAQPQAFVMPSFVSQSLGGVTLVVQDAGLRMGNVRGVAPPSAINGAGSSAAPTAPSQPSPASVVVSQNPAAGSKVIAGSAIDFEVR